MHRQSNSADTELIDGYIDGTLDAAEFSELDRHIREDSEFRRLFREYLDLDAGIHDITSKFPLGWQSHAERETSLAPPRPMRRGSRSSFYLRGIVAIAGAAALVTGFLLLSETWSPRASSPPDPITRTEVTEPDPAAGAAAVVNTLYGASFPDNHSLDTGELVYSGQVIALESGILSLNFTSGATLTLEGSSQLLVESGLGATLSHGKMRAHAPPSAVGFVVKTERMTVVDLGTEFALDIPEENPEDAEVHVISGRVQVFPGQGHESPDSPYWDLVAGQALLPGDTPGSNKIGAASESIFFDPETLIERVDAVAAETFSRWLESRDAVASRPDTVVYFTFGSELANRREFANEALAGPETATGTLVGCEWLPGRWPEKSAIGFKGGIDRIRLNVPGEFPSLTLYCWIQITSAFPNTFNGLLLTDGFDHGEAHWQIRQNGRLHFSIQGGADPILLKNVQARNQKYITMNYQLPRDPPGAWKMVAVTYDGSDGKVVHYVDGRAVYEGISELQREILTTRIGPASIGNWGVTLPFGGFEEEIRNLGTRIDEFAILSSALDANEIKALYEAGSPHP